MIKPLISIITVVYNGAKNLEQTIQSLLNQSYKNIMSVNKPKAKYRKDIDGLRAIAVVAVIIFHLGFLPFGYLGVDVFFVISGFLITKILFKEVVDGNFSIVKFYLRRIRRIIPLVLFITLVALIIGILTMLPNDLENLAESLIATNLFGNNILQFITTGDYWNILNEFKPLMHTWSLGVEEQYYFLYPLLFLFFKKEKIKWILPSIVFLTLFSLILFIYQFDEQAKFYLIQYRFFELAIGGIGAIVFNRSLFKGKITLFFVIILVLLLSVNLNLSPDIRLILTAVVTLCILLSDNENYRFTHFIMTNKSVIFIGKISFSLYMWHQLILAFSRYFVFETLGIGDMFFISLFILVLSIGTYYFIEQPFRNKNTISTSLMLIFLSFGFIVITGISAYIKLSGGVLKDIPELAIKKSDDNQNTQVQYNMRIVSYQDSIFDNSERLKVLIIGNSYSRDWANILLESKYSNKINLSYIRIRSSYYKEINKGSDLIERWRDADYIYISEFDKTEFESIMKKYDLDNNKVWIIGVKNFGHNNGFYYNNKDVNNYCEQRAKVDDAIFKKNKKLKHISNEKYIDILSSICDQNQKVPVFNDNCEFISQDCYHLMKGGAQYFGSMVVLDDYFHLQNR